LKSGGEKLTIFITAPDEPLVVNGFIEEIVKAKGSQIIGIGLVNGRSTIPHVSGKGKDRKKSSSIIRRAGNVLSLVLIFGVVDAIKNAVKILYFKFSKATNKLIPFYPTKSIEYIANKYGVPLNTFSTVSDKALIDLLHNLKPDVIINQAPGILRESFLDTASIGVLNRHNALLPKNRGRFSPFWALYKQEQYTGVTIHFVVKELDAGQIIVQKRINISKDETVSSLIKKCYSIAPSAMVEAIENLESGEYELLPNSDEEATYNTNPTLEQVLELWRRSPKIKRLLSGSGASGH
jgi:methionyl-tRNA formyltransferase